MSIENIKIVKIPEFIDKNGTLIKVESNIETTFEFKRFFQIYASKGDVRGYHAHTKYYQFMFCSLGKVMLVCEDGKREKNLILDEPNKGIIIPPMIWCHQQYLEKENILTVLSDGEYNESEYIREYKKFIDLTNK